MGAYQRDTRGIAAVLKSAKTRAVVQAAAEQVADSITSERPDLEPGIHPGTSDRAVVTVAVANGALLQARDGLFTRAAASAGLEVKAK